MKTRKEISTKDTWDLTNLYPHLESWEKDLTNFLETYPVLLSQKETLSRDENSFYSFFSKYLELDESLSKIFTYAHLLHDEDLANPENKGYFEKAFKAYIDFKQLFSWIEPFLLSLPEEVLNKFLNSELLQSYTIYLKRLRRLKDHILDEQQENLLALSVDPLDSLSKAFNAFNNVDTHFPPIKDSEGKEHPLTHGTYGAYMRSQERVLRENAFKTLHTCFQKTEHTLTELLLGHVKKHVFEAKARRYSSCLEAALFPYAIPVEVYHSLIKTVRANLPVLHHYMKVRKKILNIETMHLYDLYVPLVKEASFDLDYHEAAKHIGDSVSILGTSYQDILREGLEQKRWVDRYENKGKRSGAYSGGCYGSYPYILMNYNRTFNDMKTLAHEAGHSMHSYLSRSSQEYLYSDYSIFVAEVASTFNEELLLDFFLKKPITKEQKIYILNQKIDDIRTTLFRQTMFAEFELFLHESLEKGIPLTTSSLKEKYYSLNKDYFGPNVHIDQEIMVEPLRIPHFYSNFYVYQYATGISAALALAHKVLEGKEGSKDNYLNFLSSGSRLEPIEALKLAGVNMTTSKPVQRAIDHFAELVKEMENYLC